MELIEKTELIVVSDLHLSAGHDDQTRKYCRNEDFFFDDAFKRFLEFLQRQNSLNKRHSHLVIAGDMFDFLQVNGQHAAELYKKGGAPFEITRRERRFGLGTEAVKTVWKLGLIAKGHEVFFEALADFLSKGNRLSIITGNHDIELYWPKVQDELVRLVSLRRPSKAQQIKDSIRFYPWFYYDKDYKTYIEHGNQYDTLNSFEFFLCPILAEKSKILWLPVGSFFVRYFFNKLEVIHPFADNMKPYTKYIRWAWKEDKIRFLRNWRYLPTLVRVYLKDGNLRDADKRQLEAENTKNCQKAAQDQGLPPAAVEKVYSSRTPPFTTHKVLGTFLSIFTISTFSFVIITAVMLVALLVLSFIYSGSNLSDNYARLLHSLQQSLWSLAVLILPGLRTAFKSFQRIPVKRIESIIKTLIGLFPEFVPDFFQTDHFLKARQIRDHLKAEHVDVQTIIFGHTHDADMRPDARDTARADTDFRYFNTGTWTTVFSEEERIFREEKQFAFVRIRKEKDGTLDSTLCRWNDCAKRAEKVILPEAKPPEFSLLYRIPRAVHDFVSAR